MIKINATTNKITILPTIDGLVVQIPIDRGIAPRIGDLVAKEAEVTVEIKRKVKKRSINANNYFWALCEEIAKVTGADKETIYRAIISRVGVWDFHIVRKDAVADFVRVWGDNGVGWFAEQFPLKGKVYDKDGNELKDVVQLVLYYGSSTYDSIQMGRLINEAIMEAEGLGIPVDKDIAIKVKETWAKDL